MFFFIDWGDIKFGIFLNYYYVFFTIWSMKLAPENINKIAEQSFGDRWSTPENPPLEWTEVATLLLLPSSPQRNVTPSRPWSCGLPSACWDHSHPQQTPHSRLPYKKPPPPSLHSPHQEKTEKEREKERKKKEKRKKKKEAPVQSSPSPACLPASQWSVATMMHARWGQLLQQQQAAAPPDGRICCRPPFLEFLPSPCDCEAK